MGGWGARHLAQPSDAAEAHAIAHRIPADAELHLVVQRQLEITQAYGGTECKVRDPCVARVHSRAN